MSSAKPDLIRRLNSAMTHLVRRIRAIDDISGLGRARLSVLAVLHFGGPMSPTALAAAELVTTVTMHHILKGLEADGLVTRSQDPEDKRRHMMILTRSGRSAIERAHKARLDYLGGLALGLKEGELAAAVLALEALRNAAAEGPYGKGSEDQKARKTPKAQKG